MRLTRRALILSSAAIVGFATAATSKTSPLAMKVYKDPACDCCGAWVDHLKAAGFQIEVEERADLADLKKSLGVPDDLTSCHTGVIDGYAIEGHVPAADVKRFVAARPKAKGLAVPGMPINSPGMEIPGEPNERYTVWQFEASGKRTAFAVHG
jgi:hypothetical protein